MTKFEALKKEACEACVRRGHKMGNFKVCFQAIRGEKAVKQTARAVCKVCGMEAEVDTRPAPNGIDISGEAAATNCAGK